jgi:hypothetical protein
MSAPPTPPTGPLRPAPCARALLAVGVVALAVAGWLSLRTLQGLTSPTEVFNRVLLSSDELFPEALYADLATGACDARAFQFSAATFAFPDLVTYAGTRVVAGSRGRAILPWAAVGYLLLVGASVLGARAVLPLDRRSAAAGLVLLAAAAYLGMNCVVAFEHRELAEFFLPLYHHGAAAAVLVGLVLVAGMCRRPGGWRSWRGPALLVLAAATTFSDRLFAVWLPAPLVAAAVLTRLLRGRGRVPAVSPWPGMLVAVVALGIGSAVGAKAVKWVSPEDALQNYWTGVMLDDASRRFVQLATSVWDEVRGNVTHPGRPVLKVAGGTVHTNPVLAATLAWLALCVVTLAARLWANLRGADPDSPVGNDAFVFLAALSLFTTALNVAVVCASKTAQNFDTLPWEESARYLLVPQVLGWFGWAVWVAHFTGGGYVRVVRLAAVGLPVALVAVVLVVAVTRIGPRVRDVLDPYPSDVATLDRVCAERGLTCGLADYGTSKRATVLSRTGLVVRQVCPLPEGSQPFAGYHWLSNAQWYWRPVPGRSGPVRYEFVVTYETRQHPWLMNTARVVALLGEPVERVPIEGGATLLVYNRPTDVLVRDFAEADPVVRGLRDKFEAGR